MPQVPQFDKNKKKKALRMRLILIGLVVAAVGIFGYIYFRLRSVVRIGSVFQQSKQDDATAQSPITPAPMSSKQSSIEYNEWMPYFFKDKLIYCDHDYRCRAKTNLDASQIVYADRFSDGMARVSLKTTGKDDSIVYLDTSGKIKLAADANRDSSGPFSEGLAYAVDKKTQKIGFIDKRGKYVISPKFALSGSILESSVNIDFQLANCFFSSGLAPVYNDNVNSAKALTPCCGYIDHKGSFVIQPVYLQGCAFAEGRARVLAKDESRWTKRWGFIDPHGKRVIQPVYNAVLDYSEDLAAVLDYQGRWGFVDKAGNFKIPSKFSDADSFSEGIAAVAITTGDKKSWGYITKDGSWLVQPRFDKAEPFHGGEAHASNGDAGSKSHEDFWIDKSGKIELHSRQLIPFDIKDLQNPEPAGH